MAKTGKKAALFAIAAVALVACAQEAPDPSLGNGNVVPPPAVEKPPATPPLGERENPYTEATSEILEIPMTLIQSVPWPERVHESVPMVDVAEIGTTSRYLMNGQVGYLTRVAENDENGCGLFHVARLDEPRDMINVEGAFVRLCTPNP